MSKVIDKKIILVIILVLGISLIGGWYFLNQESTEFQTLSGEMLSFEDLKGKVILLDFMATWCGPCRASMSDLLDLHEELGDRVEFISISVDPQQDTQDILKNWKNEWNAEWRHIRDTEDPPLSQRYKIRGIPTYIIIDQDGDIVHRHVGLTSKDTIRSELMDLLEG